MKKTSKRIIHGMGLVLLAVLVMGGASFLPTLRLQTANMSVIRGQWVDMYYEREDEAAKDVFNLAEEKAEQLAAKLGFSSKQDIKIYIYDNQATFQTKKYGLIAPLLGLDWYIGDNRGTNVLLTSPARPGAVHDYKNNKEAALHEMVHAYNSLVNPRMPLWLNEGAALYLTNGDPPANLYHYYKSGIPSLEQIRQTDPIKFHNMGGYDFAYTYIEYLDVTYGWDRVLALLRTNDYEAAIGKNSNKIYDEWMEFLKMKYNKVNLYAADTRGVWRLRSSE